MKGYVHPEPFRIGTCFLCREPCDGDKCLHFTCAIAYSDEKERRIRQAKELAKKKDE